MRDRQNNMTSAEIVTIGTEMLLGDLVDTNTAWLSIRLATLGVGVYRHTTVGDNRIRIVGALGEAASRADLVITTGGLGPTSDDLTNECLAAVAGREMVEYPEARAHVDEMFSRFGRTPTANNYKQALFPKGTRLIPNPLGTAMGALLEADGTLFATLPGVPSEMRGMFEETLESAVGHLLAAQSSTLALAESCTGGLLAKRLTDMPGSSAYFKEGLVTYSNESKERLLGVPQEMLAEHGAVSEPVARKMAEGARRLARTDYGLSVTGIAGPDGGTEEKPVGLVFVGLSDAEETFAERLDLSAWARSRDAIRERSANRAFDLLRLRLEERKGT